MIAISGSAALMMAARTLLQQIVKQGIKKAITGTAKSLARKKGRQILVRKARKAATRKVKEMAKEKAVEAITGRKKSKKGELVKSGGRSKGGALAVQSKGTSALIPTAEVDSDAGDAGSIAKVKGSGADKRVDYGSLNKKIDNIVGITGALKKAFGDQNKNKKDQRDRARRLSEKERKAAREADLESKALEKKDEKGPKIKGKGKGLLDGIINFFITILLGSLVLGFINFVNIARKLFERGTAAWEMLFWGVRAALGVFVHFLPNIVKAVKGLVGIGRQLLAGVLRPLKALGTTVSNAFKTLATKLSSFVTGVITKTLNFAKNIATSAFKAASRGIQAAGQFIKNLPGVSKAYTAAKTFTKTATKVGTKVGTRVLTKGKDIVKAVGSKSKPLIGRVSRFVQKLFGSKIAKELSAAPTLTKGLAKASKGIRIPVIGPIMVAISSLLAGDPIGKTLFKTAGAAIGGALGMLLPIPFLGMIIGELGGEFVGDLLHELLMGGGIEGVVNRLKQKATSLLSGGKFVMDWAKEGFSRYWKGLPKFKIPDFPEKAPDWIPGIDLSWVGLGNSRDWFWGVLRPTLKFFMGPLNLLMGKEIPNIFWMMNPFNNLPLLAKSFLTDNQVTKGRTEKSTPPSKDEMDKKDKKDKDDGGGDDPGSPGSGDPSTTTTSNLPPGSVPAGTLNLNQLVHLVKASGANDHDAMRLASIAMYESSGNSKAHNPKYPDNSYGLWQINMLDEPGYMLGEERRRKYNLTNNEQLWDPATNAKVALDILRTSGWSAWSTNKLVTQKDLDDAKKALNEPPPQSYQTTQVPTPTQPTAQNPVPKPGDGTFEGQIKKVQFKGSQSRKGTKWFKWKQDSTGRWSWWSQTGPHAAQAQKDYAKQQLAPAAPSSTTPSTETSDVSIDRKAGVGGGGLAQWMHGNRKSDKSILGGGELDIPGHGSVNPPTAHDHFGFSSRSAAVRAYKALKKAGFSPYEFEGFDRLRGHSLTGGHFGPMGDAGAKARGKTDDGTAFDVPWSSAPYGQTGPISETDYAASNKAARIAAGASGAAARVESESAVKTDRDSASTQSASPSTGDWARDIMDNFGIREGDSFKLEAPNGDIRATRKQEGWHLEKFMGEGLFGGEKYERVKTWGKDNNNKHLKAPFIKSGKSRIKASSTQESTQPATQASTQPATQASTIQPQGDTTSGVTRLGRPITGDRNIIKASGHKVSGFTVGDGMLRKSSGGWRDHHGLDIMCPENTYIAFTVPGVVKHIGTHNNYGGLMDVHLPSAGVYMRLAHCNEYLKKKGDKVPAGVPVAKSGGKPGHHLAGNSSAPHLHWEANTVETGSMSPIDPSPYAKYLILSKTAPQDGQRITPGGKTTAVSTSQTPETGQGPGSQPRETSSQQSSQTAQVQPGSQQARQSASAVSSQTSYERGMSDNLVLSGLDRKTANTVASGGRGGMMAIDTSAVVNKYNKSIIMGFTYKKT